MQNAAVGAHSWEPAGDGGLGVACVANHNRGVHAFGHQPEHQLDAVGSRLQVIECGVAAAGEILASPLAAEAMNVVLNTPFAVANEGMQLVIGDAEAVTKRIETGITGGADLLLASPFSLAFGIGFYQTLDRAELQAQAWQQCGRGLPVWDDGRSDCRHADGLSRPHCQP